MAKMKTVKDIFEDLDSDWKDAVATMSVDDINSRIAEVAKAEELNQRAKEDDLDLARLKEEVATAGAQYKEATKANKLKIKFAMRVLGDRGVDVG